MPTAPNSPATAEPDDSRGAWRLHVTVAVVGTITGIVLVDGPGPRQLIACGLAATILIVYLSLYRRLDTASPERRPTTALTVQVVFLALLAGAVYLNFWAGFLLAALNPVAYLTLGMRAGHAMVVVLSLIPTAAGWARTGDLPAILREVLPWSLVTIAFSVGSAIAIGRLARRTQRDAQLLAELEAEQAATAERERAAGEAQERRRLASDLHDTVTQGLSSIALLVEAADRTLATEPELARRHLEIAARAVRDNLQEARSLVDALAPPKDGTFIDVLRRLAERTSDEAGLAVELRVPETVPLLATQSEVALLRVTQEALANVRRHARATRATVTLTTEAALVRLEVADDGEGFDLAAKAEGHGLAGMRQRIAKLDGTFVVTSSPGAGTRVQAELPA